MFNSNFGVEVLASTPWEHDVVQNDQVVGSTKHLPPSVLAQYFPMSSSSKFQPYFGLGLNYTAFFDESGIVESLDNSFGLALSAGFNYHIDEEMMFNFGAWKIDIDAELNNNGTDVEIDPLVMMLGVGYKF
jgi:outer membrane protein